MCVVVELIEGHTEEEVKYTLGKMCLVLTQISAGLKVIQGASDRAHNLFRCGDVTHSTSKSSVVKKTEYMDPSLE